MASIITINGVDFPIKYMVLPSYLVDDIPIVVDDYRDSNYDRHVVVAPQTDISITFDIRELKESDYADAMSYFTADELTLSFRRPATGVVDTGVFIFDPEISRDGIYSYVTDIGTPNEHIWIARKTIKLLKLRD